MSKAMMPAVIPIGIIAGIFLCEMHGENYIFDYAFLKIKLMFLYYWQWSL